ncbi:MAG: hypothetical protein WA581_19640 [Candidatus Acidiferrales bacterium]
MAKKATGTKTKAAAPARPKRQVQKKKPKARWHEDAVIHQDVPFAEAGQ